MLTYATMQMAHADAVKDSNLFVKVLLVSDCIENFPRLKTMLRLSSQEVTYLPSIEEPNQACQGGYDVIVVDVGAEHIVYALREIRASTQLQKASVLVRAERLAQVFELTSVFARCRTEMALDSEKLAQEFTLSSVFTKYRAMPGSDTELAKLVSLRLQKQSTAASPSFPNGDSLL